MTRRWARTGYGSESTDSRRWRHIRHRLAHALTLNRGRWELVRVWALGSWRHLEAWRCSGCGEIEDWREPKQQPEGEEP